MDRGFDGTTILVTGGLGFIGSNFIRDIHVRYPGARIVNIDIEGYAANHANLADIVADDWYTFVRADIADKLAMRKVFAAERPDYVINFAAESHVDRSIHGDTEAFVRTNVSGVHVLLEELRVNPQVRTFLHVSTDEVFGSLPIGSSERFSETSPYAPNSVYASTKAAGDHLCRAYFNTWKLPIVVTHSANNFGPYQLPEKLVPFAIQRLLEGKTIPLYGDGLQVRDWLHVADHVRALELCLLHGKPGSVYVVGAEEEKTNREIAERILSILEKDASHIEYITDRPGHDRRYASDSALIRKELGWKPEHSFDDAFEITVTWYMTNQDWMQEVNSRLGNLNAHI